MTWSSKFAPKSAPKSAPVLKVNSQGSAESGKGEWQPVFQVVKDGFSALKMLPLIAIALAILALVSTQRPQTFVSAMASACTECLTK